jgi:hypothetical protein
MALKIKAKYEFAADRFRKSTPNPLNQALSECNPPQVG